MADLTGIINVLPKPKPHQPTEFEKGVAEELRTLAESIEVGYVRIKHFSLTADDNETKIQVETS